MTYPDDPLIEAAEQPVVPVDVGEVVAGKYKIGGIIGFGGMATVAAAHHLELDQPVAIKFLQPEAAARPEAVRRFLSEARAAARLNSPHVARVIDVGTAPTLDGGIVPYMVMELLEGMRPRRDAPGSAGPLARGRGRRATCSRRATALAEAHALGIVHRDLKPANLFLTRRRDGTPLVKVLDFGISKTSRDRASDVALTADREMMGSPLYMSPEQVQLVEGRRRAHRHLVARRRPLRAARGRGSVPRRERSRTRSSPFSHDAPQPIAKTAPDVPRKLVEVVMRCLQKAPEARYPTVDALAAALAPFRSSVPLLIAPIPARSDDPRNADAGVSVHTVRTMPKARIMLTGALSFAAVGLCSSPSWRSLACAARRLAWLRGQHARRTDRRGRTQRCPRPRRIDGNAGRERHRERDDAADSTSSRTTARRRRPPNP